MQKELAGYKEALSNGMIKGIQKQIGCGFAIPTYPGRYPNFCPECGADISSMYKRGSKHPNQVQVEKVHIFPLKNNMYKLLYNNGLYVQYSEKSLNRFLERNMVHPNKLSVSTIENKTTVEILNI